MSSQVIVFGSAGQLGTELVSECTQRGHSVTGLTRADVDVTESVSVEQVVSELRPSVILNATAYNLVDRAEQEPEAAMAGNAFTVRNLAIASKKVNARLVHVSTDYVFDGSVRRPYTEQDHVRPLGAYGVSKLAGEHMALAYSEAPLIVRTCGVFGVAGLNTARGNFVETMLRLGGGTVPVRVVADVTASPTYAPELAARIMDLLERDASGVFHAGGGEPITWFDFARMIFEEARVAPTLEATLRDNFPSPAMRPRYSALSNSKMSEAGAPKMPPLRDCVRAYMERRASALTSTPAKA